ncbi:unnamed protein product [Leptidea sinapis]|uniref:DUF4794 domain-containing protein n=1 Tax=Leptidea sinapis TaxID=189913 RepID=A0A5E4R1B0_9NEOP|nr:unnamed protein product [Leptidea sinapis]
MKVAALVMLALSSVSALGSGPYLPSGWRPEGPAFYLPSETQRPAENPVAGVILHESEASGSDALREYGPPKVGEISLDVSQNLVQQGLPDTVIEQVFGTIEVNEARNIADGDFTADIIAETALDIEGAVTEPQFIQEQTTLSAEVPILVIQESTGETLYSTFEYDVTQVTDASVQERELQETDSSANESQDVEKQNYEIVQFGTESNVPRIDGIEEQAVAEVAENIPEVLANLENEISAQVESKSSQTSIEENAFGSLKQAPEGFLEYGPPGFKEYGPPKELSNLVNVEEKPVVAPIFEISNQSRRRRFSPKFRIVKISPKH